MTTGAPPVRTVLIVEDNALLKAFLVNLVERTGFAAIQAGSADEAIPLLESRNDIALLITNVVMRGSMDGVGLAHAVDTRWPSIRIIVVSGRAGLCDSDLPANTVLLEKPYHEDQMAFEIRALLGAASAH